MSQFFGVIVRDEDGTHTASKCTLCYDRLEPACAKACPTDSIIFGEAAADLHCPGCCKHSRY